LKIKILSGLILVIILSILFLLIIYLVPQSVVRIALGLPFLLYFPGYALISALFLDKQEMEPLERIALRIILSVTIAGLIGFALNYTPLGIRLEPVLLSITLFIILISSIALIRQALSTNGIKYYSELIIRVPGWQGSTFNKTLSLVLIICIAGAFGVLGYTIAFPKNGEKFTEFYILGLNGKAQDYPTTIYLKNDQVKSVQYGNTVLDTVNNWGRITIGVVNHEGEATAYYISSIIDGEEIPLRYQDISLSKMGPINLNNDEKWEGEIGIVPQKSGENQKVEIQLYNGNNSTPIESVHIWINVKELQ
jgi:uncharacterized membrane protein